jgi:uncharacterized protein (DUF1697 family)
MLRRMKRYAALLRGVSPMNAKMPELKRAFERAGFSDVKTVLATGNVVFSAKPTPRATLERKVEAAMAEHLPQSFLTIVRSVDELRALLERDAFARYSLKPGSKRVVTFLKDTPKASSLELPIEFEQAKIWHFEGSEVFCSYVPGPRGPVFMTLLQKTFGKAITTRTWDTIVKIAK